MIDLTKLHSLPASQVGRGAMSILDRVQHMTPETQAASLSLAIVALLRQHNTHASVLLNAANNMLERAAAEIPGLKSYVKNELK